jgi:hypothetical protein
VSQSHVFLPSLNFGRKKFGPKLSSGLPDGLFSNKKIPIWENILRATDWKILLYFLAVWNISWTFGIFYYHLEHFVIIWYIFPVLVPGTKKNLATPVVIQSYHHQNYRSNFFPRDPYQSNRPMFLDSHEKNEKNEKMKKMGKNGI